MPSRRPAHRRHPNEASNLGWSTINVKIGDIVRVPLANHGNHGNHTSRRTTYGLVRSIVPIHVQYLERAERTVGPGPIHEFFLVDGMCATLRRRDILQRVRVRGSVTLVSGYGVWRQANTGGCDSCIVRSSLAKKSPTITSNGNGFKAGGKVFHLGDFACVAATQAGTPWKVGIISRIKFPVVEVRLCMRYSDLDDARRSYVSEREIVLTDRYESWTASEIVGKAVIKIGDGDDQDRRNVVLHIKKRLPNAASASASRQMLIPLRPRDLPRCKTCHIAASKQDGDHDGNHDGNADFRIPSIDLYAGGGGSVLGASRHFEVRHAVDLDRVCCDTLKQNRAAFFPRLMVHQNAVRELRTKQAPHAGNVALMIAGPPCQGFSRANHHRRPDDARNDEINVTLEEVARLRPYVFVLENVPGIRDVSDKDDNKDISEKNDNDGHRHSYLQTIVRRLVALEYQVRVGALNAADYGAPQTRLRYIVLASRLGITLPSFPSPTHSTVSPRSTRLPMPSGSGDLRSFSLFPNHGSSLLPGVTAKDALHDLPIWNYVDYHHPAQDVIGPAECAYVSSAQNDYQRTARAVRSRLALEAMSDAEGSERPREALRDHVTARMSKRELDVIQCAPRVGGITDLPKNIQRLRPHEAISTLLTSSRPGSKQRSTIHYACNRTLTVAERKRAQGFPDAYQLAGTVAEKDRILGNAINVTLMDAICLQVKLEVFAPLWRELGRPDSDTFWRKWKERHP